MNKILMILFPILFSISGIISLSFINYNCISNNICPISIYYIMYGFITYIYLCVYLLIISINLHHMYRHLPDKPQLFFNIIIFITINCLLSLLIHHISDFSYTFKNDSEFQETLYVKIILVLLIIPAIFTTLIQFIIITYFGVFDDDVDEDNNILDIPDDESVDSV